MNNIGGTEVSLSDYSGQILLLVNVASKCGLTPHYKGLEELYKSYKDKGFQVLGFPCNQFGSQEPGTEAEIQSFCEANYGVSFPLFSKIEVNGAGKHPLYAWLTGEDSPAPGDITWNFEKFLIGKDGQILERFGPKTEPSALAKPIEAAL